MKYFVFISLKQEYNKLYFTATHGDTDLEGEEYIPFFKLQCTLFKI